MSTSSCLDSPERRKTLDDWKNFAQVFTALGRWHTMPHPVRLSQPRFRISETRGTGPLRRAAPEHRSKLVQLEIDLYWITRRARTRSRISPAGRAAFRSCT